MTTARTSSVISPALSRRAGGLVVMTAVLGSVLAGCAAAPPAPHPQAAPAVPPPVLSLAQTTTVLSDLGKVLTTGDAALDPNALTARVMDPALAMRHAEYLRAQATNGQRPPTALPTSAQAVIEPRTSTWPRTQVVVSVQPDDLQAPRLLVLEQATPREQYRLWGWARLFPGVSMPATATPGAGSPVLSADASGLSLRPDQVMPAYADVLSNGDGSQSAPQFAPDPFRTSVTSARQTLATNVKDVGNAAETYTPDPAPLTVIGTVDGGALVIGKMTTVSTVSITVGGAKLTLSPVESALAATSEATQSLVRTYTDVLVFRVPPAGSTAQVQLVAAEAVLTAVAAQ
ncbi:hypothetical protein [Cellulomonas sp. SG140]|uniref:hypothetical protein n=1 Tax=Cellulomonas sp. SG140 TaxID=2976536 RepID=UPI0021E6D959|nr:hypothetical protein [Cellulomonas sp. SG140]